MRTNVEKRKIDFVQSFLNIKSEETIQKFEDLVKQERLKILEMQLSSPMSMDIFNKMIDRAEQDAENGRVTEASER